MTKAEVKYLLVSVCLTSDFPQIQSGGPRVPFNPPNITVSIGTTQIYNSFNNLCDDVMTPIVPPNSTCSLEAGGWGNRAPVCP